MNATSQSLQSTAAFPFKPVEGETLASFEGFLCYFDMGNKRSLKKVAAALDVHETTVKEWSAKYGWVQRILDYRTQLFNARLTSEVAAARETALLEAQSENLRLSKNLRRAEMISGKAERLLEHYLLTKGQDTELKDILRMFTVAADLEKLDAIAGQEDEAEKRSLRSELEETFKRIDQETASDASPTIISQPKEGSEHL